MVRSSKGEAVLPSSDGPLYIPRGDWQIVQAAILFQRRKDLWGEDADEFMPERWLDERNKELATDPFKFMAWGAGPR